MTSPYTPEFKERAVSLYRSRNDTYSAVARELGINHETLSKWVRAAENESGEPSCNPFQLQEELRKARRENERLREENEILLKASAFFAARHL